ncbi:hypothetical protein [Flavobacterium sp.]|uniref:hypothetical protein n=1 Tax=Flavobacterium sp. TaxID=239 RepID=UPI003D6B6820
MNISQSLSRLIKKAKILGLNDIDVQNSTEMLEHNEFELCLDIVLTQLYEYDIKIDEEFYDLSLVILSNLKINIKEYDYIEELR